MHPWEVEHRAGTLTARYPYDSVVTFLFRYRPAHRAKVLEVGCGAANNLWVVAREGDEAFGVDISPAAIELGRGLLARDGLDADLRVGDFTDLPWPDAMFDLAIDRQAITCVDEPEARKAMAELHRVVKPGGRVLFNPLAAGHSSEDRTRGTHAGTYPLRFYTEAEVRALVDGWTILAFDHVQVTAMDGTVHAEWRSVVER